jgi:hypothetical protein
MWSKSYRFHRPSTARFVSPITHLHDSNLKKSIPDVTTRFHHTRVSDVFWGGADVHDCFSTLVVASVGYLLYMVSIVPITFAYNRTWRVSYIVMTNVSGLLVVGAVVECPPNARCLLSLPFWNQPHMFFFLRSHRVRMRLMFVVQHFPSGDSFPRLCPLVLLPSLSSTACGLGGGVVRSLSLRRAPCQLEDKWSDLISTQHHKSHSTNDVHPTLHHSSSRPPSSNLLPAHSPCFVSFHVPQRIDALHNSPTPTHTHTHTHFLTPFFP